MPLVEVPGLGTDHSDSHELPAWVPKPSFQMRMRWRRSESRPEKAAGPQDASNKGGESLGSQAYPYEKEVPTPPPARTVSPDASS